MNNNSGFYTEILFAEEDKLKLADGGANLRSFINIIFALANPAASSGEYTRRIHKFLDHLKCNNY